MMEYNQIPNLEIGGKNPEEKETRHDLDTKLIEDRNIKNEISNIRYNNSS